MAWLDPKRKANGPPWYVRWRQEGKVQRSEGFYGYEEAESYLRKKEGEFSHFKHRPTARLSVDSAWIRYIGDIRGTHRDITIQLKNRTIGSFLSRFQWLEDITRKAIEDWQTELKTQIRPTTGKPYGLDTVSIKLRNLRTFIRYCYRKQMIPHDIMMEFQIDKSNFKPNLDLSNGFLKHLLHAATTDRFRKFLAVLAYTGCRRSEANFAFEARRIKGNLWFIPAAMTKTNTDRTVILPKKLLKFLGPRSKWPDFKAIKSKTVYLNWRATKKRAGINYRFRLHDLRHRWTSKAMNKTKNPKAVMENGGWKDVKVMMRYLHVDPEMQQRYFSDFDPE